MYNQTHHCDLCGKSLESDRANGWKGHLRLTGIGNFFPSGESELVMCSACGSAITATIEQIKKPFRIITTVEELDKATKEQR